MNQADARTCWIIAAVFGVRMESGADDFAGAAAVAFIDIDFDCPDFFHYLSHF
jgi:hypothetical protein